MNPILAYLTLLLTADADHLQANPLYRDLIQTGVPLSSKTIATLPRPSLEDGLDGRAQQAVLRAVAARREYELEQLLEESVTARFVWETRVVSAVDARGRALAVDVWFVAHGDLKRIGQRDFLERQLQAAQRESKVHLLSEEELTRRKLTTQPDERYSHAVFMVLNEVQVSATTRTVLSRTDASLLFASQVDPRFANDTTFPNQWRSLQRDDGQIRLGPAQPYGGAGSYLKITRLDPKLAGQPDALFVEAHLLFVEPTDWFPQAPNNLRSKLPTLIQDQVRSFRKQVSQR